MAVVPRLLVRGRAREEEVGVETLRLGLRGDPVGERDQVVAREHEVLRLREGQHVEGMVGEGVREAALDRVDPPASDEVVRPAGTGEEDPAFLECLADGRDPKREIVFTEPVGPFRPRPQRRVAVGLVHRPAGIDEGPGCERAVAVAGEQEQLRAVRSIPAEEEGGGGARGDRWPCGRLPFRARRHRDGPEGVRTPAAVARHDETAAKTEGRGRRRLTRPRPPGRPRRSPPSRRPPAA